MSSWNRQATREQVVTAALLLAALLARLTTFRLIPLADGTWVPNHLETDELIYRHLVAQISESFWNYSLQGTSILPGLLQEIYDKPYFLHPPLFVYSSWLLEKLLFIPYQLVPVLHSLATVLCARAIAKHLYPGDESARIWAMVLLVTCPLGWFLSQKYWIDGLQALTAMLSFLALLVALEKGRLWRFLLAGLAAALGFLAKYLAVVAFPALVALYFLKRGRNWSAREIAALALPTALLGGAWVAFSLWANGSLVPTPLRWDPAAYPYMARINALPWYRYLMDLAIFTPAYLLAFASAPWRGGPVRVALFVMVASYLAWFTLMGPLGAGYPMRFLAPVYPVLAVLAAPMLARLMARARTAWLGILLLGVGLAHGVLYGAFSPPGSADFTLSVFGLLAGR